VGERTLKNVKIILSTPPAFQQKITQHLTLLPGGAEQERNPHSTLRHTETKFLTGKLFSLPLICRSNDNQSTLRGPSVAPTLFLHPKPHTLQLLFFSS